MVFVPATPTFSQYHLPSFDWSTVRRALILPTYNATEFTRAGAEIRRALAAEIQNLGFFEVVSPPPDHPGFLAEEIHVRGRFNEATMLSLAREFSADVVIHIALTQYQPHARPRIGLVVQAVGPIDAKVVASVDGLWDASRDEMANRAQNYYRSPEVRRIDAFLRPEKQPYDSHSEDLALDSPALFQRFVLNEVVANLVVKDHFNQGNFAKEFTPLPAPSISPAPR
jgi:hypothetical protein